MSEPSSRMADLSPQQKRALLTRLLQRQAGQATTTLPLSYNQQALWLLSRLAPTSWAYHVLFSARLRSALDTVALQRALEGLIERHPSLRTTYTARHGQPEQHVHPQQALHFEVVDTSAWSPAAVEAHLTAAARRPFDLERGPLMRVQVCSQAAEEHIFLLVIHHIAVDLWSLGLLLEDLRQLYPAARAGIQAALPPLEHAYTEYVRWQSSMLTTPEGEQLWAYWQQQLHGAIPELSLPTDRPRPPVQTYHGTSHPFVLPAPLSRQLKDLARARGVTLHSLLLAAFYVLLYRYSGQDDILVGTFMAGRMRPEFRRLVGYFANPVVLRATLAGNPAFSVFLAQVQHTVLAALKHQDFPFSLLVERLQPVRDASRSPLFQVAFVLQQLPQQEELLACFVPGRPGRPIDFGGLALEPFVVPQQEGQFDLTLEMAEIDAVLCGALKYNTDLFAATTMARLAGHWQTLLSGLVADPEQPLLALPLLSAAERQQLLVTWGRARAAYASTPCLHEWFEAQVERTPEAVAVVSDDQRLTYRELNCRANQLAHYLQALGVGPEVLVGLYVERSLELVVAVLGILKAGGAYVPLDPAYPAARLAFMLEDARVAVLVTQSSLRQTLPATRAHVVCVDTDGATLAQQPATNPPSGTVASTLAYVIYTSGSTGQPKGVMVSHGNVVRLFTATQAWFHFAAHDVWTLFHSSAFDFSVWELWGALLYGGRLVVVPYWVSRAPADFYALLCRERVTVLNQTPSAFRQLIRAEADRGEGGERLALRLVIFGGEALDVSGLQPWFARHGDTHPRLVNMYGITETTVHVTSRPLTLADARAAAGSPIGGPIPDLALYVLDAAGNPAPIGVPGELYVGGAGVARGYLNRPALTAQRFLAHPFDADPTARVYKSGDLARYLPDGTLEYLGRMDQQVKIRGFRIELGEIETVLGHHPLVQEAVVVAREDTPGETGLVAYVVPGRQGSPTHSALRAFLHPRLPEYMIPAAFVILDRLPLTTNGKVDRRALPAPDQSRPELAREFVAPRTVVEQELAEVFGQVLHLQQVGIHDNFFELGGDSIRALQVQAKAAASGWHFALPQLFQHQTVAELGQVVSSAVSGPESTAPTRAFSLLPPLERAQLPGDVEDAYPLTLFQAEMLRYSQCYPAAAVYHDIFSYHVRARFTAQAWHTAWHHLVARHAILRTAFDFTSYPLPLQMVYRTVWLPLAVEDLRHLPGPEQEAHLVAWREAEKGRVIDHRTPPLLRVQVHWCSATTFWFTLSFHHAILDGWSVASMLTEIWQEYMALVHGQAVPPSPPPALSFRDFVAQEQRARQVAANRHYWSQQLPGSTMTRLPAGRSHQQRVDPVDSRHYELPIPSPTLSGLQRLARSAAVPLKSVLLAAHLRALSDLSKHPEVLTGLVSHARPEGPQAERTLGLFLNVIPLRLRLPEGSWRDLVHATFKVEQELLPFRHYPVAHFPDGEQQLPRFETVFNFIHFHVYKHLQELPGFSYLGGMFYDPFPYTLKTNFIIDPFSSQLLINMNYNNNILSEDYIKKTSRYYQRILSSMSDNDNNDMSKINYK